ncbi:hypothetical protein CsSME_00030939 [Camellia sinensis var. sinensis]
MKIEWKMKREKGGAGICSFQPFIRGSKVSSIVPGTSNQEKNIFVFLTIEYWGFHLHCELCSNHLPSRNCLQKER